MTIRTILVPTDFSPHAAAALEYAIELAKVHGARVVLLHSHCESRLSAVPAVAAILEAAEALPAELIPMGTQGLTGIKHALLGSVAERVVRLAPCPVMTVKAPVP